VNPILAVTRNNKRLKNENMYFMKKLPPIRFKIFYSKENFISTTNHSSIKPV